MTHKLVSETHLYHEIYQQPESLERLISCERSNAIELARTIEKRDVSFMMLAARGTSDNAGRYAKYLFGSVNRMPVALAAPSLFTVYERPPVLKHALVIGISQSGKSPDIVAVLAEARRQGALALAITNNTDSELAQEADFVLNLQAGIEQSIAATKTYTAQLVAIALLSSALSNDATMWSEIDSIPEAVANTLAVNQPTDSKLSQCTGLHLAQVDQIAQRFCYMRDCIVIGRGYNYATAFELALKLKELTYVIAEPYSSADFLHGPLALIERGFPVIVVAPSGKMTAEMLGFLETLNDHEADTVVISNDSQIQQKAHISLPMDDSLPEWLTPITAIIPGQLLALHLAHARRLNPDKPRSIHKVTKTL